MYALLCKPIAVPTPSGSVALRAGGCRIVKLAPTQAPNILELEILEAPPIYVGTDEESRE